MIRLVDLMYIMYTNYVMYRQKASGVPAPFTVKARGRHGTSSLDLTIPTELMREHGISEGDVFLVEVDEQDDELTISYQRIHEAEPSE
jgi:hypothetical protein